MIQIAYTLSEGKERIGLLVQDNAKTAIIKPYRWVKCDPIKVHKVKNQVKVLCYICEKPQSKLDLELNRIHSDELDGICSKCYSKIARNQEAA